MSFDAAKTLDTVTPRAVSQGRMDANFYYLLGDAVPDATPDAGSKKTRATPVRDCEYASTRTEADRSVLRVFRDSNPNRPRMLTLKDFAEILQVSPRTVRRLVDQGRCPQPCRLGRACRWEQKTVQDWIAGGCPKCRRP